MPTKQRRNDRPKNGPVLNPPQLIASLDIKKTIRFQVTGSGTGTVNVSNLLDLLIVATAAATGYRLLDAIRMRKIEMWAPTTTSTTTVLTIEDINTGGLAALGTRSRVIEDVSVGYNRPAHLIWRPARGSLQDSWFTTGTSPLLTINSVAGTIVDVTFDMVIADGQQAPTGTNRAIAGATVGQVYCSYLWPPGNAMNAVGLLTI